MSRKEDFSFEISFYESILRREPDYVDVIEILGGLYTRAGRIADGLKMDRELVRIQPENATAYYNLACSLALSALKNDALHALAHAVLLGYRDASWMAKDPDLDCVKQEPTFKALLAKIRSPLGSSKQA